MIKLVISDTEGTTTVVPLVRDEISIGRKEGNTIRLTERNISREHCRLQRHNGSYVVHDLRSYNGVLLNGQRIAGESAVKPGDELRIGDYTLQLQLEERERKDDTDGDATRVSSPSRPVGVGRLVVLTPPLAGAEFPLPEKGELKLGRGPELDVFLDHRSVSREHAKIACDGAEVRILDAGSVNGVVVNREKVTEARLVAGDVIELGDVLVRYVGPGELYVFDPAEARALTAPRASTGRSRQALALAIVGVAVIGAILIARGGRETSAATAPASKPATASGSEPGKKAAVAPAQAAPAAAEPDHFTELLDSCRQANEGGRYAEAIAHATAALKARPDAREALECQESARVNHEQEQIYVRGKAAFEAGDNDGAWKELASLSPTGAVRQRAEVFALVANVAGKRLALGQAILRKAPEQAGELASSVLMVVSTEEIRQQAQALADRAAAALRAKANKPEATARAAAAEPRPKAAAPRPAQAPHPAPVSSEKSASAMEAAAACLARGDNACVVRTLSGRAQTAQELGLLVETYRAMGDSSQAYKNMAVYVQRFPTARRAEAYRQMLERQGQ